MLGVALTSILLALSSVLLLNVQAQADPWSGVGAQSFYWHNRYHGCLAMSAYGDSETECPQAFTQATLQRQYPGNTNQPFEVVGQWGPTPIYKSEGYMVRVPEMNKILMVFKGIYGWQNFNATLSPFLGIGCDSTCEAHTGALEAWAEVKAATNDMQAIKSNQRSLVFSATGHGFGGMIAQIGALDLKHRGFVYSCQTFGSPPVFNAATAAVYNALFPGDSSQRTVANNDSIPSAIPIGEGSNYTFVNTGIHVFGTSSVYGQDFKVCEGWAEDPECAGGSNEADHEFYFTDRGSCGERWDETYDPQLNAAVLASDSAAYVATATAPLLSTPITSVASVPLWSPPSSSLSSPISTNESTIIKPTSNPSQNSTTSATSSTEDDDTSRNTAFSGASSMRPWHVGAGAAFVIFALGS